MGHPALDPAELDLNVRLAQKGDQRALGWLVEQAQGRLYRFFLVLIGNPRDAEDFCQDTLIKALEHLGSLKDPRSFMSWLFRMGKNLFLDHVRSPRNDETASLEAVLDSGHGAKHPDAEMIAATHRALLKLTIDERLILLLIDLEEHSYSEAAEIMGISEAAVRSRLHRARQTFREKFEKS